MSLSRRQFLFSLGAGVVAGTQFDRFGGEDPVVSMPNHGSVLGPTPNSLAFIDRDEPPPPRAPGGPATIDAVDRVEPSGVGTAKPVGDRTDRIVELDHRAPSMDALEWREVRAEELAEAEIAAQELSEAPPEPLSYSGASMEGWRTVLGDARHTAAGLETVNPDDVVTEHEADRSRLVANRHGRGVMAHNTTYFRTVNDDALHLVHTARADVRTPVVPQPVSGLPNGQTVEIALFVWDGKGSRRDIGLGLQWMINPWSEHFGALRTWVTNPDGSSNWTPEPATWLDPTDEWQTVEMFLDPQGREARLSIAGQDIEAMCTETQKPDNWAYKTAAAFAVELISIWPDDRVTAPTTTLECRDWSWDWSLAS
ncbi:MAG: hypothetical protein AAF567_23070 [Actinomycetota bacterium]